MRRNDHMPKVWILPNYTYKRGKDGKSLRIARKYTKGRKIGEPMPDKQLIGWKLKWIENGKPCFQPVGESKVLAYEAAAKKTQQLINRARGLGVDEEQLARPITEHIKEWLESIEGKSKYANEANRDLSRMVKACKWRVILDIRRDQVEKFLRGLTVIKTGEPAKSKTKNLFLGYLKSFLIWCKERDRVQNEFVAKIEAIPLETITDAAEKRALSLDEINKLLASVPEDRGLKYLLAICTGLRSGEIGQLTRENFVWEPKPTVFLAGEHTKNGEDASQPLDPETAKALRPFVESKKGIIWPWSQHAARTLQRDLKAIGIDPEGMDFHGLRRTLVTLAWRSGLNSEIRQDLARHSDRKTHLKYLKLDNADKRAAAEQTMKGIKFR